MSTIAVLGSEGMLGRDLMGVLAGPFTVGFSHATLDITDREAVLRELKDFEIVINTAAYTKVDDAEKNPEKAFAVNALGAENIAIACREHASRLIHVSTDYVFDGMATAPYPENHPRNPQSLYGKSKAAGEDAVLMAHPTATIIVRTAWLYGAGGSNFVHTMLNLATQTDTVAVVTDQIGQPTWSRDVALMIKTLVESEARSGIFHGTNSGQASWWDFARAIFDKAGLDSSRVIQTTSANFVRPAPRPAWSVLGHEEWAKHSLPIPRHWSEAFSEAWLTVFRNDLSDD